MARILVLALLAGLCAARTYIKCPCSPTTRGFKSNALVELKGSRAAIDGFFKAESAKRPRPTADQLERMVVKFAQDLWAACISNYDAEQCVNADTALRGGGSSFCHHNKLWKNVAGGDVLQLCTQIDGAASLDPDIVKGAQGAGIARTVQLPSKSPTPSPSKQSAVPVPNRPSPSASASAGAVSAEDLVAPEGSITPTPSPSPSKSAGAKGGAPTRSGEGCIAVEHLRGYSMQHREHLTREVLCANNFCATPNHALIVAGRWTSMRHLCASGGWQCVRSVKLVNNLNVFANRRAVAGDITITPYDLRFPRSGVFLVQALERLLHVLLDNALVLALTAAVAAFAYKRRC